MHVKYIEQCLAHSFKSVFNAMILSFSIFTSLPLVLALGPWGPIHVPPCFLPRTLAVGLSPHHFFTCFPAFQSPVALPSDKPYLILHPPHTHQPKCETSPPSSCSSPNFPSVVVLCINMVRHPVNSLKHYSRCCRGGIL